MSKDSLNLGDYDCIGFDLDNTLLEYEVEAMSELIYNILANFLITNKGYSGTFLKIPFESGKSFLQRGLLMDFENGNILKLDPTGKVLIACHGTRNLNEKEIESVYGPSRVWDLGQEYINNILGNWNGFFGDGRLRFVHDYFDVTVVLIFARIIDTIDAETKCAGYTPVWPDILAGLSYMYDKDGFSNGTSEFFSSLKENPLKYVKRCPISVIKWLQNMRQQGKLILLITGSAIDFAHFTASTAIGPEWQDLFDLVVTYARKPGFFLNNNPFKLVTGLVEGDTCNLVDATNKVVSNGNWKELEEFIKRKTGRTNPRVIYIGDNVVQDVLAPVESKCCDALAIYPEVTHTSAITGTSPVWGSFFYDKHQNETLWTAIIKKHSSLCISSVTRLAEDSVNNEIHAIFQPEEK